MDDRITFKALATIRKSYKLGKLLMIIPIREDLKLNRTSVRKITELLTEQCNLKKHLHNMVLTDKELLFRLCN